MSFTDGSDALLTPAEVGVLFRVDAKTVTRWAHLGKLSYVLTPGGHHRFSRDEVMAKLRSTYVSRKEGK